jgi:pimeloyl-ACP methyl ester carboxylesterase
MSIFKSADGARAVESSYRDVLAHWPVPNEQRQFSTRAGDTFVVSCGPSSSPPVLLLQGSGATAAMWLNDVAVWAEAFRVHAVDVIGEPGLSAPTRPRFGSDAFAEWLDDVMDGLSLRAAAFVGVSLGGWLALDYAIRRPDRVTALVLLCPAGIGRQRVEFFFRALPLLILGRRGRSKVMRLLLGRSPVIWTMADGRIGKLSAMIGKHFRRRRDRLPVFSDDELRRLTMPVMLIVGGRDVMLDSLESKRRLEGSAVDVTTRFLPDAGHILRDQSAPIHDFLLKRVTGDRSPAQSPIHATDSRSRSRS